MARGILFDVDGYAPHIMLYLLGEDGSRVRLETPFSPTVYLWGSRRELPVICRQAEQSGVVRLRGWVERREFYSNRLLRVMAATVIRPDRVKGLYRQLTHRFLSAELYDSTLDPVLAWLMANDLYPMARVEWEAEGDRLRTIRALDSRWDARFSLPDMRTLRLSLGESPLIPPGKNRLVVAWEDQCQEWPMDNPARVVTQLEQLVARLDPDLVWSEGGDGVLFPWLVEQAQRMGKTLNLDRDPQGITRRVERLGRSFMHYGQITYKAPSYPLIGRWHLDTSNSFFIAQSGLEGLVEMARIGGIPVQRMARSAAGTALTNMEIRLALRAGYLIPSRKTQLETPKTALTLLKVDKGGLSYFPPAGMHQGVVELDYAQMYPTLMLRHNVSPETMNCPCCEGQHPVPGTPYHTCVKRRGLIPETIRPVLEKRTAYKQLKREAPTQAAQLAADQRYSAIKWLLVTTFGYQGYKNARFGLIEAHEAVTALGREALLQAKEAAEAMGFTLLHGLTDSLYMTRQPPASPQELAGLSAQVHQSTGLDLALEGMYHWICFPTSKTSPNITAATRYFGRFESGETKARGLMLRRRDTPPLVKAAQQAMLAVMAQCGSVDALNVNHEAVLEVFRSFRRRLLEGRAAREDLWITMRVSRPLEEYKGQGATAICLQLLAQQGITLSPGQSVRYLIVNRQSKEPLKRYLPEPLVPPEPSYDLAAYLSLLQGAYDELAAELACHKPEMGKRVLQMSFADRLFSKAVG